MTTTLNSYLQRADDFIQQQIYKFEQKKQGRDYTEMQSSPQRPPRAQTFANLPPQGPPAPKGWSQEFDQRSQRWYYLEHSTRHSQWDPPSIYQARRGHRQTLSVNEQQRPQHDTQRDEEIARRMQEEEEARARGRGRSSSQMSRPTSGHLAAPQQQRPLSSSPHPSPHGRLPPGAHLDMRTGQVVTSMYPPGHSGDWTRPE
ncbi:hypothetical protein FB567DRAFT_515429 [Paraphoma chrysanthemicola]|uniref:WW domain-containing protein n=1 Tax=Paraphoma chrysanthemicola TaxID=798071 RepID=A0A8K0RHN9_9PLEO|nr:hypothetical protein FB567DRAFT_515429 [Paraphoma chrysanthemicola]